MFCLKSRKSLDVCEFVIKKTAVQMDGTSFVDNYLQSPGGQGPLR